MIKEKAYAKVNLCLEIVGKRSDGYHDLKSVFVPVDFFDEVTIRLSDELVVFMDKDICIMEDNICYKVAKYLIEKYHLLKKVRIDIIKNIPSQAGLGGGSSDAAAVIRGVNRLFDLNLSIKEMEEIGGLFGSDVPFFIKQKPSKASSRGEKLEEFDFSYDGYFVIGIPSFKSSTKDVFSKVTVDNKQKGRFEKFLSNLDNWENYVFNDLEEVVDGLNNGGITIIKEQLLKMGCLSCVMTGSGSCVVGFIKDKNKLLEKPKNMQIKICHMKRCSY